MLLKTEDKTTYVRTVIDHINGGIIEEEWVHKRGAEPPFIKLYLDCLCDFKGLSKSLNPILLEFLKYMTYANTNDPSGGQIIYLNAALKKNIVLDDIAAQKIVLIELVNIDKFNFLIR